MLNNLLNNSRKYLLVKVLVLLSLTYLFPPEHYTRFDSQHEFKVYQELVRMYGADRVLRQHRVQVVPPGTCYPNGKTWRVDFAITSGVRKDIILAYVEAKGAFLSEFGYTLSLLELHDPIAFLKLRIVFVNQIPATNRIVNAIKKTSASKMLMKLPQLRKLSHLP